VGFARLVGRRVHRNLEEVQGRSVEGEGEGGDRGGGD